jgi:hypothetical protein
MPYEFRRHEEELEPEAGGSRLGGPPHKHTAAGVLDPPVPPRKPPSPIPAIPPSVIVKIFAVLILLGVGAAVVFMFLKNR